MLKIYDANDSTNVIPLPIADDKRYVKHVYGGYDKLTFEIESNSPLYKYIAEEVKVEDESNAYVIKLVDEHSDFVTVTCEIDLDDWKEEIFESFRSTNSTLQSVLESILPNGWTIVGASQFAKRTTVEDNEGEPFLAVNAIDILDKAAEVYSCVYKFDTINKIIEAIDPETFQPSGQFFTDELNLKSIGFTGKSQDFATRLYAYGKKDENGNRLTFASINGGKEYVEDYTYSDKIISVGWSDERYTNKESLLADARAKLAKLSYPVRSYSCDASRLGEGVWLYKVVTLIDRRRQTRVNHRIIEYDEYPNHVNDKIKLSSLEDRIESQIDKVKSDLKDDIAKRQSTLQQILQQAIDDATEAITGNKGGNFVWIFDSEGRPVELVNLGDTLDINTAQKVWRWNASGLGHSNNGYSGPYTLALLADGSVNASAITTGLLTANIMRAGRLQDVNGLNYWDLETGEFRLVPGNVNVANDKTLQDVLDDISDAIGDVDIELTQQNVFNALTNNGQVQGIYLQNGRLYLNASYIGTGIISDNNGNPLINLTTGKINLNGQVSANNNFVIGSNGKIKAVGGEFSGKIIADDGSIGGITINNNYLRWGDNVTASNYLSLCTPHNLQQNGYYGDVYVGQNGIATSGYDRDYGTGQVWSAQMYWGILQFKVGGYVVGGIQAGGGSFGDHDSNELTLGLYGVGGNEMMHFYGSSVEVNKQLYCVDVIQSEGTVYCLDNLYVYGTKSRVASTKDFGDKLLYCYEMPSPVFGDIGEGKIGEDGLAYIELDPVFEQTINSSQYHVFLQAYGDGKCYVYKRHKNYFIVKGDAGLSFSWEIKAKQADFDQQRLDPIPYDYKNIDYGEAGARCMFENHIDYGSESEDYINFVKEEMLR